MENHRPTRLSVVQEYEKRFISREGVDRMGWHEREVVSRADRSRLESVVA